MNKQLMKLRVEEIIPYQNNPRKNERAAKDVAESIKQCGYAAPIIIDENNIILAGHTRFKALQQLGYEEIEVLKIEGMTEEQKKKYRLLDNKTGEKAVWDLKLLELELNDLDFDGYDFGFKPVDEIDLDRYEPAEGNTIMYTCPHCGKTFEVEAKRR